MSRVELGWERMLQERLAAMVSDGRVGVVAAVDRARLQRAYRYCARITRRYHPAVYTASLLLRADRRRALQAMAAFLWRSDALSERHGAQARRDWHAWCRDALAERPPIEDDVLVALADVRVRHRIPRVWVAQELEGLDGDHRPPAHEHIEDLVGYCFDVLAPAALMMLRIFELDTPAAIEPAVHFAVAVQLTDMLRDIGADLADGRVYLPASELEALGIDMAEVAHGEIGEPWRVFLRRMIACNRRLFRNAEPGIGMLPLSAAVSTRVMGVLYRCQLRDIEARDYDVFQHPPRLRWRHLAEAAGAITMTLHERLLSVGLRAAPA